MKLIVGLGNPGKEYAKTRHNIGFSVLDQFVKTKGFGSFVFDKTYNADILKTLYGPQTIIFVKPQTFMNRSGFSVSHLSSFYKINPTDILIIHDEIDFPLHKIQLKLGGSPAGHNGLKDIISTLGNKDFRRLRIGIDRPIHKDQIANYVLTDLSKTEIDIIDNQWDEIEKRIVEFLDT